MSSFLNRAYNVQQVRDGEVGEHVADWEGQQRAPTTSFFYCIFSIADKFFRD
jgi:hypothetical protein